MPACEVGAWRGTPRRMSPTSPIVEAQPELLVIDATALLFRAYFGMRPRRAPDGTEVGAVFGLAQLVLQIVRREGARRVALVYDAGRTTFRNRIDPRYKAQRGEPPPELVPQFDLALRMGQALGFAAYSVPDYEADDLMATLARVGREEGLAVRLCSVDKDVCQLVRDAGPATRVMDPKTGALCDEAGVRQRMGVPPRQVVDAMALIGDSSDNIPGVRGIGPRAAVALLEAFEHLEGIYADLGRVEALALRGAKGLAQKLAAGREEAFLARRLVQLCDAAPLEAADEARAGSLASEAAAEPARSEAVRSAGVGRTALPGDGRKAAPRGPGGLLARTRWREPDATAPGLFAELGSDAPLRWFATVQAALVGV